MDDRYRCRTDLEVLVEVEAERDALRRELDEVKAELDGFARRVRLSAESRELEIQQLRTALAAAQGEVAQARSDRGLAEGRLEAVRAEVERLKSAQLFFKSEHERVVAELRTEVERLRACLDARGIGYGTADEVPDLVNLRAQLHAAVDALRDAKLWLDRMYGIASGNTPAFPNNWTLQARECSKRIDAALAAAGSGEP